MLSASVRLSECQRVLEPLGKRHGNLHGVSNREHRVTGDIQR